MYKARQLRTTFGSCDVEKVHAAVAQSTFPKSKCTKHLSLGPLLEVEMSKKCTPLWREAHFQVKMLKTKGSDHFWSFRCRFASPHCTTLHYTTLRYTTFHYTSLRYATLHYTTTTTTLHYTKLDYTTLHYTTLHSTTLHYTTFRYTSLHYTTLH